MSRSIARQVGRSVCVPVILLAFFWTGTVMAAGQTTSVREVGNWQVRCRQGACLVVLFVTHAANNTVVVKVDGTTMEPANFGFEVSGEIDSHAGLIATFARTTVDSANPACGGGKQAKKPVGCYHLKVLKDEMFRASFLACQGKLCFAKVPGRFAAVGNDPKGIDLLRQFEADNLVLFVYRNKEGQLKRRVLDIDGFKTAYDAALSVLRQQPPSHR